jgi:hypothetical protein
MRHAARELTARGVERWDANFISPQAVHIADRVFGDENIAYYDAETGQHLPMTTDQAAASVERVVEQTHGGDDVDEVEDCSIQARIDLANYQDRPEGIAPAADRPQPQFASRTRYQPTLENGQDVLFVDVKGGEMSRTVIRDQQTGELVSDSGSINVRAGYSSQGREEYLFRQTAAELASRGVERWDSNIARPDLVRTAARVFGDERMAYYDYDPHDATNTEIPLPMTTDQAAASAGRIPGKSPEGVRAHVDLRGFPTDTATPDNANRLVRQTDAYVEAIDIGQNEITANRAHPDQALVDGIIARAAAGVTTETMHPTHSKPDHRNGNRTYYVDQADNPTIFAKQTQLRQRADGSTKPLGDAEVMHARLVGRVLDTVEAQVIVRAEGYEGVSYVPPLAAVHNAETQTETIFYPWQEGRQLEESGDMEEIEPTPPDSELARLDRIGYALVDLFQANGIISEDFSDQHFLISTDEWGRVSLHVIDTEGFEITRPAQ